MRTRRSAPPPLILHSDVSDLSFGPSVVTESDDEENRMIMAEYEVPKRPLTVAIPTADAQHPYCPRKPALSEILANTAPPPWTLTAFMAYLSHNHCLETLEFTMDASRYRQHYNKMASRYHGNPISPGDEESLYVKMLWQRMLDAYILPNGPREVNLPSDVRDELLALSDPPLPPHPSSLDNAVQKTIELMEDSVLVPFLNSLWPQTSHTDIMSYDGSNRNSPRNSPSSVRTFEDRTLYKRRRDDSPPSQPTLSYHRGQRHPSAPPTAVGGSYSSSHSSLSSARPTHTPLLAPRTAATISATSAVLASSATPSSAGSDVLTDDTGSVSSPSALSDPMTPPTTPPMSDYGTASFVTAPSTATSSPRSSRDGHHGGGAGSGNAKSWRRMGSRLGFGKRSGGTLREEGGMF